MTTPLLPAEFAQAVVASLDEPSNEGTWFTDSVEFTLILKDGLGRPQQIVRLASFYDWYKEAGSLDLAIQRIVALTRGKADTRDYEVVAPILFLKIFDRSAINLMWQKARRDFADKAPRISSATVGDFFSFFDLFQKYDLVLWNDNYSSMEFVVSILKSEFDKTDAQANLVMMQVHEQGQAVVGAYPFEIAKSKARLTIALARARNFPLLCTVEVG